MFIGQCNYQLSAFVVHTVNPNATPNAKLYVRYQPEATDDESNYP